jgi:hypothetical protein
MQEERVLHEAKLAKMEAEMKMVFQQKVQEKESKLKQSEEELYARHREMKESLEKQRQDLDEKKRKVENGRPLTPEKGTVSHNPVFHCTTTSDTEFALAAENKEGFPPPLNGQRGVVFLFLEVFTVIHAFHFMACLLLSAPPCLALVSYTLLSTSSITFRLLCSWHPSLICTDIPGMFCHSFLQYVYLLLFSFSLELPSHCR